ncbi:TPA: DDE-type integrase/transposase/recombinase [Staphylococcus aureus]
MKYSAEQSVRDNLIKRHFKMGGPKTILLTDITYLYYGKGKTAYLSTIKDAYTNQILSYELSENLKVDIVLNTVSKLIEKHKIPRNKKLIIHSDQGIHYACTSFQALVSTSGLQQSMSRKGNCWDNAP